MAGPHFLIRPGMDVYTARQDRYLGTVVGVVHDTASVAPGGKAERTASSRVGSDRPMVHEEGNVTGHAEQRGTRMLGEEMGPVPTMATGNTGPTRQSAGEDYATHVRDIQPDVSHFLVRPGRINFGPLTRALTIPASALVSVSMERIVVNWE
jgi:hypothetical protein